MYADLMTMFMHFSDCEMQTKLCTQFRLHVNSTSPSSSTLTVALTSAIAANQRKFSIRKECAIMESDSDSDYSVNFKFDSNKRNYNPLDSSVSDDSSDIPLRDLNLRSRTVGIDSSSVLCSTQVRNELNNTENQQCKC